MQLRKLKVEAEVIKLRRELKELSAKKVAEFSVKLEQAEYDRWVENTRQAIAAINRRNK